MLALGELGQSADLTVSKNCSLRTAGEGDRVGRQTGSLAWRLARGELGQSADPTAKFVLTPTLEVGFYCMYRT